jgi:protein phosphatase
MRIEVAGNTHVGMKRPHNEDSFLLLPEENLCVVADGMGGHASGEVASRTAIEAIESFFRQTGGDREITWPFGVDETRPYAENRLLVGIRQANARIVEMAARDPRYKGMGTTLVSLLVGEGRAWLGWAGDSRAYRYRDGRLVQLSEDHSLVNDLLKANRLTAAEAEVFPHKNVIVRALGMKDPIAVDVVCDETRAGDVYLLCSDGLSGMVSDERIEQILGASGDLDRAVQQLIDSANAAGGVDNVTAVLARIGADPV